MNVKLNASEETHFHKATFTFDPDFSFF